MRSKAQQYLALGQRLAHQPESAMLQIAQPTMDQLGGGGRCAGGKVVLLHHQHAQASAGGIARNASAIDATADDGKIVIGHACRFLQCRRSEIHFLLAVSRSSEFLNQTTLEP
jgi:hypothetical protein